jgi:hypothetical protein
MDLLCLQLRAIKMCVWSWKMISVPDCMAGRTPCGPCRLRASQLDFLLVRALAVCCCHHIQLPRCPVIPTLIKRDYRRNLTMTCHIPAAFSSPANRLMHTCALIFLMKRVTNRVSCRSLFFRCAPRKNPPTIVFLSSRH